jgi:DNA-binding CsgD family transcriptional regulator
VNDFLRQKYRRRNGIEEMKKHLEEQASQKEEIVSRIPSLTFCEFRVFRLLGMGMTNGEMGQSLHVSLDTIKSHIKKIHKKCAMRDRAKLALLAHTVCFDNHWENPEEDGLSREAPRPRPRGAHAMSKHRHPELGEPAPACPPVDVDSRAGYSS